jgi:hypothetical protein
VTGQWFSPGPPVSSTNKTECHDINEILLKVALNTIKQTFYTANDKFKRTKIVNLFINSIFFTASNKIKDKKFNLFKSQTDQNIHKNQLKKITEEIKCVKRCLHFDVS